MQQLNLPQYKFRIKKVDEKLHIFDSQRKKYISLTPEEWVRQNFIRYLIEEKEYPAAYLAIEKQISINGMKKRCDAILYNIDANPIMIIEFKAPGIQINQQTFDQAAVYNYELKVDYLIISNGLSHYCCKVNSQESNYSFFREIPTYKELRINQ